MTKIKPIWNVGRHSKDYVFRTRFQKLKPEYQWRVHHAINTVMRYSKDPLKTYKHEICKECKDGLYLFGIADNGLGHKGVELMLFLDYKKKIILPIFCKTVNVTE
ncbi:MAG: hypothetical protein MAG458_00553 [Nitrosopumilus sp.]|nr:hypothetical protein [Nitrosopumilus sp.]